MRTPERLVLCGGARPGLVRSSRALRLSLLRPAQNITLRIQDIGRKLLASIPEVLVDLLELAAYVHCADGAIRRGGTTMAGMGAAWRRRLRFVVPVREPDTWASPAVRSALVEALGFLSDDEYDFEFEPLQDPTPPETYLDLTGDEPRGFQPDEVVLFSGGLDSLAGAVEELIGRGRRVALVSHRSGPKIASHQAELVRELRRRAGPDRLLHVPVLINKDEALGREFTHRSRSFLYASLAMVVARLFGLAGVRSFENGIVSLHLPIAAHVLGARATRTTHPQVLRDFGRLFSALLAQPFTVDNPYIWRTKAEVVRAMADQGCTGLIRSAVSCTRVRKMTLLHSHCGTCSQCIGRRFAVLAAGLQDHDPEEMYGVDLLTGQRPPGEARTMIESYVRTATDIQRMTDLAFFGRFGEASRAVRHLPGPASEAGRSILDLHKRHADEVCRVVDDGIRSHASTLRARALPDGCLLVLTVSDRAGASRRAREPLLDPAQEDELGLPGLQHTAPRSGPEIRIAFDAQGKCVLVDGWPSLTGRSYELLELLRQRREEAERAGRAPENYPFVEGGRLAELLGVEEHAMRRQVSRVREQLAEHAVGAGRPTLPGDALIENQPWVGYRLNPAVRVLAPSELTAAARVTSPRRRGHSSRKPAS